MRFTKAFIPTLKESPADAEVVSHRLMIRAGMIRKLASGIYDLLPLGLKAIRRVETIVREEMDRADAQEVLLPVVLPAGLWKESGRWELYGKELLRLKDRGDREFCLGPTHEEAITDMVRREVRSYRDLPLNLYQIQIKFRDEMRPRFGLMRAREFIMKDAYSFHATDECAEREYENMRQTYTRIFHRCGLEFTCVEAETGTIGGSFSHEFMVLADTGESSIVVCQACGYSANTERAEIAPPRTPPAPAEKGEPPGEVHTPGKKGVDEVAAFLGVSPEQLIKTLIFTTEQGPVAACVRGTEEVNPEKLKRAAGVETVELADDRTIEEATGGAAGFSGPVGLLKVPVIADYSVMDMKDAVTGANKRDYHLVGVTPGVDFNPTYMDIRVAKGGDPCPRCSTAMILKRGIEVGHIFKLGVKYSESMGALFIDESGRERPIIMGCYGIGIGRTVAASIEQNHDEAGIIWPAPLAPYHVHLLPVNMNDEKTRKKADSLYETLRMEGYSVLYDDRDIGAGIKFKDADLLGMPLRLTVSGRTLKEDSVEIRKRRSGSQELVHLDEVVAFLERFLRGVEERPSMNP